MVGRFNWPRCKGLFERNREALYLATRHRRKFDAHGQAAIHALCGTKPLTPAQCTSKWTVCALGERQTNGERDLLSVHLVTARKLGKAHHDAALNP